MKSESSSSSLNTTSHPINNIDSPLFITGIDAGGRNVRKHTNDENHVHLLSQARKEHQKICEVVEAFRAKVDRMVDKQRQDYVAAYEAHIQDVQKELHHLREKAHDIANDDTKQERTLKLRNDLERFKNEALDLEQKSDQIRSTMLKLVKKMHAVEQYRDWMLKKLRQAKKKYNALVKEKARLTALDNDQQSLLSLSQNSNYTLEVNQKNANANMVEARNKVKRGLQQQTSVLRNTKDINYDIPSSNTKRTSTEKDQDKLQVSGDYERYLGDPKNNDILAHLVSERISKNELLEFLKTCENSLHKRPWNKIQRRPLDELIQASKEAINSHDKMVSKSTRSRKNLEKQNDEDQFKVLSQDSLPLICELVASQEIYPALRDLVMRVTVAEYPAKRLMENPGFTTLYGNIDDTEHQQNDESLHISEDELSKFIPKFV